MQNFAFNILIIIYIRLPFKELFIQMKLSINETKWRFMRYLRVATLQKKYIYQIYIFIHGEYLSALTHVDSVYTTCPLKT